MRALFVLLAVSAAFAQNPAKWTLTPSATEVPPGGEFSAELKLKLESPWHMYSLSTPKPGPSGGPIATTIKLDANPVVEKSQLYAPKRRAKVRPKL